MAARKLSEEEVNALAAEVARSYSSQSCRGKRLHDYEIMQCVTDLYQARPDAGSRAAFGYEKVVQPAVIMCDSPYQMQDRLDELWRRELLPTSITNLSDVDYAFPQEYDGGLAYLRGYADYLGALYLLCGGRRVIQKLAEELRHNVLAKIIGQIVERDVRKYAHDNGMRYFMAGSGYAPLSMLDVASIKLLRRVISLVDPENEVLPKLNVSASGLGSYLRLFEADLWSVLFLQSAVVACRAPTVALFDDRNRLHSVEGPALMWGDGRKQYRVHGVPFDEGMWKKVFRERSATVQEVMALKDRTAISVAMRYIGWERVLKQVGYVVLDETHTKNSMGEPLTYQLIEARLGDDMAYSERAGRAVPLAARFVRVQCPTTMKTSVLRVNPMDPMTRTCKGAIAWTFGIAEDEYAPVTEA